MAKQSIVPFGPQHPVLPEPVHLDRGVGGGGVVRGVATRDFVPRRMENPGEAKDYKEYV